MGQLYKLDFPNGKSYIGITTKTTLHRFNGHCIRYQCGKDRSALYHAWRKHGNRNAAGKRSPELVINIKAGVAYAKIKRKEIYCWEDDGGR